VIGFLSPLFLVGALAAAVPIVLHLLRRKPDVRLPFSAVKLLEHAPIEHSEKRHLRELLLLALRVAALVLLAIAFARPFFAAGAASASSGLTLIALDTSLSLSTPAQLARAKELAKGALSRAAQGDLVGVMTFSDRAQVALRPTADRALAASAIDAAAPGFGATSYRAALATAADLVSTTGSDRATIVVVTDLQQSGWDAGDRAAVPESSSIEVADVGELPANLAITAVRATPDRVVATIRNASDRARDAHVQWTVDGRLASEATSAVGPRQSVDIGLAVSKGAAGVATVDDPDGIQGDNARYVVLDTASRPTLLVITASGTTDREAFYVQHALTAAGTSGAAYSVAGVGAGELATWDQPRLGRESAVLLLSTRGLDRRGRELLTEYVQKGGGLFIAAGPEVDGEVASDLLGGAVSWPSAATAKSANETTRTLAPADSRHPIFQTFGGRLATLGLPTFRQAAVLRTTECATLARFTTADVALVECSPGAGRVLVFASDLGNAWNDFPLHASFVPFLQETVRYLAGRRHQTGDYLVAEAPSGTAAKPGIVSIPPADDATGAERLVAINVDPAESDPARLSAAEFQAAVTRLKDVDRDAVGLDRRRQEEQQHLWQYALALVLITLVAESVVAGRTA
jgi:hypothetical protein